MLQIEKIIENLAGKRPVFHSEADFQHALAWEIHNLHPLAIVRLEIHPGRIGKREYIDIWVKDENKVYAIELKYKTKKINATQNDEEFYLLDQGAQDLGRYDFIKDIARLERFVGNNPNAFGYAIILSNDKGYWCESKRFVTVDADFRIHNSKILKGTLRWNKDAAKGTIKGREENLQLKGSYPICWLDYSELSESGPNQFKYLILNINRSLEVRPWENK